MHDDQQRILIVRLSHLGDVVHALPVLDAVRRAHPRARIAWAVQPEFQDLVRGHPGLDEIVTFDRRAGVAGWARLERELARFGASWSIDAQGNTKSALVALASRATRRSGLARCDWAEPFGALTSTDSAEPARASQGTIVHAIDRMRALAQHVAPHHWIDPWIASLRESSTAELAPSAGSNWLASTRGPSVVLHLAAPGDVRSWPSAHFAALARELARDHAVLVVAGPAEREAGSELSRSLAGSDRIAHWNDSSGLHALASFFRAAAHRGAPLVACDSGPLHVGWAAGMRVVLLAGPQHESRTGPWPVANGERAAIHRIVRAADSPQCAPCFARSCDHADGNVCMTRIDPLRVARAVREITSREPAAASAP